MSRAPDPDSSGALADAPWPYFGPEHELLRSTIRRFVADRVLPHAEDWERAGFVPRDVLREMGALGLLGIRCGERWGGSAMGATSYRLVSR